MSKGSEVRSYLNDKYATPGFEVQSGGDLTVTVALPTLTDMTSVIYNLKETFDADCDVEITTTGASLIVYVGSDSGVHSNKHFMHWWLVLAACVVVGSVIAGKSQQWILLAINALNTTNLGPS